MKKWPLFLLAPLVVACGSGGDTGQELTSEEIQKKVQSGTDSMPPEARKAMEATGRYGAPSASDKYRKSMEQTQGKR